MAKKFGKFLLFTAAVGTAAAAVYYYMQKKESGNIWFFRQSADSGREKDSEVGRRNPGAGLPVFCLQTGEKP